MARIRLRGQPADARLAAVFLSLLVLAARALEPPSLPPAPVGAAAAGQADLQLPDTVRIDAWQGRIGNNLAQLGHALLLANLSGAAWIDLSHARTREERTASQVQNKANLSLLLNYPDFLPVHTAGEGSGMVLPERCARAHRRLQKPENWYFHPCSDAAAWEYRALMQAHIRPLFSKELTSCIDDAPADDEHLLTIHLRGGDAWLKADAGLDGMPCRRSWLMTPCALYEKIIWDSGARRVLVVTSPERNAPCLPWFEAFATNSSVPVEIQSGSVFEDSCALLRARNMVLSYSSFSHNWAILSDRVRRIFTRGAFNLDWSMMNCHTWPDVSVLEYGVGIDNRAHSPYNDTFRGVLEFLYWHPVEKVLGPRTCRPEESKLEL